MRLFSKRFARLCASGRPARAVPMGALAGRAAHRHRANACRSVPARRRLGNALRTAFAPIRS